MKLRNLAIIKLRDVLTTIIEALKQGETVVIPDLIAILKAIELLIKNEKVTSIIKEIETILEGADSVLPAVVKMLEDIESIINA
ncbi:hypothetical protein AGMMS49573_09420 [Endomicrobiia bacterium]|nr:hypothetical protein AGMMS49573_09420 [Endomicrobiia bacterium]